MSETHSFRWITREAKRLAYKSPCGKRGFGAIIFAGPLNRVIVLGRGFNSPPDNKRCKQCNRLHSEAGVSYNMCPAIHAEVAAILSMDCISQVMNKRMFLYGYDKTTKKQVVSVAPCQACKNIIKRAGIKMLLGYDENGDIDIWDGESVCNQ